MHHFFIVLAILGSACGDGNTNGFFAFENTEVIVAESLGSIAKFNIKRTGGTAGVVLLTCQVCDLLVYH